MENKIDIEREIKRINQDVDDMEAAGLKQIILSFLRARRTRGSLFSLPGRRSRLAGMRPSMNMMTVSCLLSSGRLIDRDVCLSIKDSRGSRPP